MRILHLTLKKKWFDMIASGEKKEEYRDHKLHWMRRLVKEGYHCMQVCKEFDIVRFKNGYQKNAPEMDVECLGISLDHTGKKEWGFEERCYIIKLGKILSIKNYNCETQS